MWKALVLSSLVAGNIVAGSECDCGHPPGADGLGSHADGDGNASGDDGCTECSPPWWNPGSIFRRQITVTTTGAPVPADYTVEVTFDHEAWVNANQSLANGNDVRILFWNGASYVELNRVVNDDFPWNQPDTVVLFQLARPISAPSTDAAYYLYYGNTAPPPPPADPQQVYWYFDDFSAGLAGWTAHDRDTHDPPDGSNWHTTSDAGQSDYLAQSHNVTDSGGNPPHVGTKFVLTGRSPILSENILHGAQIEYRYLAVDNDLGSAGLCTNDDGRDGFYVGLSQDRWFDDDEAPAQVGYWNTASDQQEAEIDFPLDQWMTIVIQWHPGHVEIDLDRAPAGSWTLSEPLEAGLFCFALNSMDDSGFDDLKIRRWVQPPPTTTLGEVIRHIP